MKTFLLPAFMLGFSAVLLVACGRDEPVPGASVPIDSGNGGQTGQPEAGTGGVPDPHVIPDSGDLGQIQCATIGTLCHAFDEGTGLGAACHEVGHTGDPEACAAIYDECVAFCQADGGHEEEHDAGDASHEHSMCEEIGHICHDLDDGAAGLAHECHEIGHAGDEVACSAMYAQCVSFCDPANAGDAGAALCEEIGHICHDLDDGGPSQAHECHEVGHAGDVAACAAIYSDCVAYCSTDAGH